MASHAGEFPSWQLPHVKPPGYGAPPTLNVVFLCWLEESQRREILDELCSVDKTWMENRPAPDRHRLVRRLTEVPWLSDSEPSPASIPSTIFQIYRATSHWLSLIFVDRQSVTDGTAIVLRGEQEGGEAARVPMNRAVLALALGSEKSLAQVLPDFESVKIDLRGSPSNTIEGQDDKPEASCWLPPHLPSDLKPEPSTLGLISLVHLTDEKRDEIKAAIGGSVDIPHVVIYNWPADREPCSRAELYRIFQATKPPYQEAVDETFSMFIDQDQARDGAYCIILAQKTFSGRRPILLHTLRDIGDALGFWLAIWNPFEHGRRGTRLNNARVNTTLFDGPLRARKCPFEVVPCPDHFNFFTAQTDYCCFVLSQMTETQSRRVRQKLFSEVEDTIQFIDAAKLVRTPDIPGLMAYFESDQYVKSGQDELPQFFLAIDDKTLTGVADGETMDLVIVADRQALCADIYDDNGNCYGSWSPGYAYSRLDAEMAVNLCTSLSVCNMDFVECCEDPEFSCWSMFQRWKDANEGVFRQTLGRVDVEGMCRDLGDQSA